MRCGQPHQFAIVVDEVVAVDDQVDVLHGGR